MTWEPNQELVDTALFHARQCAPRESCGVIADGSYWPISNRIAEGFTSFLMDRDEYLNVARQFRIDAIVHSHPYMQPIASDADRSMCERMRLPFLIVAWPLETWTLIEPSGFRAPLVGRQWSWGSHDCFGLIRDALVEYGGVEIKDFERHTWEWWKQGRKLIDEQFEQAGFRRMPERTKPQHLDVFGMQINSPVVNHLGIFLEPDVLLHQMQERLSVREVYGGIFQKATVLHLRHEKFC